MTDRTAAPPAETNIPALRRRDTLRLAVGAGAAASLATEAQAGVVAGPSFQHGVASGDPRRTAVIIWTRVTPVGTPRTVSVAWTVATDAALTRVVASGALTTTPARDYTVKVNVTGLQPGMTYYYGFSTAAGTIASPVGLTRTLPGANSTTPFSLLVFSCSIFEKGYFNAYAEAANEPGIFAALHLGDYLYEYGRNEYVTPAIGAGRVSEPRSDQLVPPTECLTLADYRARHAMQKSDANLQALHAAMPWIVIYDDHETANDSWTGGAENHQPATEGPWKTRERQALQAYYEWMPLRDPAGRIYLDPVTDNPTSLYRAFPFGRLANLIVLDTRLAGRDQQLGISQLLAAYADPVANDTVGGRPRSLMGTAQEAWVDAQLSGSTATWQLIGNQTLCYYQPAPDYTNFPYFTQPVKDAIAAAFDGLFGPGAGLLFAQLGAVGGPNPVDGDSWTGYPSARARFNLSLAKAANPVVLSGDSHNAWAANLRGNAGSGVQALGVEFGGMSVTSPGLEEYFYALGEQAVTGLSVFSSQTHSPTDTLAWAQTSKRGYMRVDVGAAQVTTTYVQLSTVFSPSYTTTRTSFTVQAGARRIAGT